MAQVSQTYPGNSRFNLFSVTCNDVDLENCALAMRCTWTSKVPKRMAQTPTIREYTQYSLKTMDFIRPIPSYCGILGHYFGHFGGPGSCSCPQTPEWGVTSLRGR